MRIVNQSRIRVDRRLWKRIADALGLGDVLPAAESDDLGMFESPSLIVRTREASVDAEAGSYSYGQIDISVCEHCTEARVLWTFCHELVHAWFHSYDEVNYFDDRVEDLADEFANSLILDLGGCIGDPNKCGSYNLPEGHSEKKAALILNNRFLKSLAHKKSEDNHLFELQ